MAITVVTPVAQASPLLAMGTGLCITGTISGPTALDDFLVATLNDSFIGQEVAVGRTILGGSTGYIVRFTEALPPAQGCLPGRTLSLTVNAYHANGTLFDTAFLPAAYINDPTSGLAGLFGTDSLLGDILRSVRGTFTTS